MFGMMPTVSRRVAATEIGSNMQVVSQLSENEFSLAEVERKEHIYPNDFYSAENLRSLTQATEDI